MTRTKTNAKWSMPHPVAYLYRCSTDASFLKARSGSRLRTASKTMSACTLVCAGAPDVVVVDIRARVHVGVCGDGSHMDADASALE